MKKVILLSAVLLGAVSASQAGIRFNFGFSIPLGPPPVVVSPPPVYVAPAPVCQEPRAVVYQAPPPVCYPAAARVYYQVPPPVVYARGPAFYAPAPRIYVGFGSGCHRHYYPGCGWRYRGGCR